MVNDILSAFMRWKSLFKSDLETDSKSEKHCAVSQSINKYLLVPLALNTRKPGSAPGVRQTASSDFFSLSFSFSNASSSPPTQRFKRRKGAGRKVVEPPRAAFQHSRARGTSSHGEHFIGRVPREEDGLKPDPAIPKTRKRLRYAFLTSSSSQATLARNTLK